MPMIEKHLIHVQESKKLRRKLVNNHADQVQGHLGQLSTSDVTFFLSWSGSINPSQSWVSEIGVAVHSEE